MHPFFKSFTYAYKGIKMALSQRNMKVHIACALLVILAGYILHINSIEWCIISLCIGLVIVFEMINTAIEYLVDMISPEFNEKAGKIKDIAAGAVLVISIVAFICGILVFGKYIVALF
jgi:diacylglycerol kinase